MKKALAVLLVILTLLGLCACSDNNATQNTTQPAASTANAPTAPAAEDDKLLPYSLKFGMGYDEAENVCQDFPKIEKAQANDGFFSEGFSPEAEDYWTFFGIDSQKLYNNNGIVTDPQYYFSFNESKKLYEFYVMCRIYDSEGAAEVLFNEYLDHYNETIDTEAKITETDTELSALYETDTLRVSVILQVEDNSFLVYTVIHNKTYELSN